MRNDSVDTSPNFWDKALTTAQIIYMIRVPILAGSVIFLFPLIIVYLAPTLFRGLYDFQNPFSNGFWFSLFTFLFAWTAMITSELVFFYGTERLGMDKSIQEWFRKSVRTRLIKYRLTFIVVCAGAIFTIVGGTLWINWINTGEILPPQSARLFGGIAVGFIVALALLFVADLIQSYFYNPKDAASLRYTLYPFPSKILQRARLREGKTAGGTDNQRNDNFIVNWLKRNKVLGRGYFCYEDDKMDVSFQSGHYTAITLFIVFLLVYAAFGFNMLVGRSLPYEVSLGVPAIVYLPILASLVCWGLSGMSFFLDSYRIPLLLPLGVWILTMSFFQANYYQVIPIEKTNSASQNHQLSNRKMAAPEEVIEAGKKNELLIQNQSSPPLLPPDAAPQPKEDYIIVVAADGGGIQAAAWTARVLTGLEKQCRKDFGSRACGSKIRLISSVSGGTVGAMYFVAAYNEKDKGLPADPELDLVVKRAAASSLSNVAWGLAYSDFLNGFLPFFATDRGQELEKAWAENNYVKSNEAHNAEQQEKIKSQLLNGLSTWKTGIGDWRPAVIFNAAIAETGERFLLSTSDIDARNPADNGQGVKTPESCEDLFEKNFNKENRGSRNFYELFPCHDIPIVTAARLSASFPYVTPTGRAKLDGNYRKYNKAHIVDGGYYDNYGIVSIIEWLKQKLNSNNLPKKVLVVQIRSNDTGYDTLKNTTDGWFFQLTAPLKALYNVRTTGQRSRGDLEFENFKEYWETQKEKVTIKSVIFNFRLKKDDETPLEKDYEPPLSWHLSLDEVEKIDEAWSKHLDMRGKGWDSFKNILNCYRNYDDPAQCPSNGQ